MPYIVEATMEERFGETPSESPLDEAFPPETEEHHGEEDILPEVSEERRAEARENLRKHYAKLTEEDLDELQREKTKSGRFELFIQKLMERYRWRRGVCQQQLGDGFNDIRDC
jgi:hypothetical protein